MHWARQQPQLDKCGQPPLLLTIFYGLNKQGGGLGAKFKFECTFVILPVPASTLVCNGKYRDYAAHRKM